MKDDLRAATIRLAHTHADLRPHLLPLLKEAAAKDLQLGDTVMWHGQKGMIDDVSRYSNPPTVNLRITVSGVPGSKNEVFRFKRNVPMAELERL